ncbi:MAG TPA: APC family permease [Solirubrobacterales bacterium]|nr:APC family permease [Solirubrobacterales bacterium]
MEREAGNGGGEEKTGLRRVVSRRLLFFFILGDILGGGIYALVGEVGGEVGGAIWASFLVALLLAALTAASYAELVTKYPRAGGAALYAKKAFSHRFVAFMIAFAVMASGIASASTLARGFGGDYLAEFIEMPVQVAALIFIAVIAVINLVGILLSVRLNVVLTVVELGGLLLVVVIGAFALGDGIGEPSRAFEFKEGMAPLAAILAGATVSFYALIGFEDSVNIAEETKDPRRSYPFALFAGLAAAGLIYIAVTVIASMAVPTQTLAESDGALLEVVQLGPLAMPTKVFSAIGLLALANGALINMIMASRLLYGMAEEDVLPSTFGRLSRWRTPVVAIVFTTAIAAGLILTGDLGSLADTTVLLLLGVFIAVNVSVLILRRDPVSHNHFRVPSAIPVLGIVACLVVMSQVEAETFLRAGALLIVGVLLWALERASARFGQSTRPA